MQPFNSAILTLLLSSLLLVPVSFASDHKMGSMANHDMSSSDKFGDLIHESAIDGYFLSYHFMDLRKQHSNDHSQSADARSVSTKPEEMDKPHHIMLYITDDKQKPVLKGKVGFLVKDAQGHKQKSMGMFMSGGFGATADMKKKGTYSITAKAIIGEKKLMDRFDYEIK